LYEASISSVENIAQFSIAIENQVKAENGPALVQIAPIERAGMTGIKKSPPSL
jgi:hypothetical protein